MYMCTQTLRIRGSILCGLAAIGLIGSTSVLAATVPYSDGFETNSLGQDLSGVGGWAVSTNGVSGVTGRATVTNAPQAAAEGSNYATLTNATLSQAFTDNLSNVWSTAYVQLVFTESPASFPTNATAVYFVNTNGLITAYDGGSRTTLTHTAIQTGAWARISVELDYVNDAYDLWLGNTKVADNLGFYTNLVDDLSAVGVNSEDVGGLTLVDGVTANTGAPVPPEIRFVTTALTVLEGATVTGRVVISFDSASDVSINVNPTGGTATAASDYTLTETTVTIPGAGSVMTQSFTFVVTDDAEDEGVDETIVIGLEDAVNCSLAIADTVMTVTIDDTNDVYGLPFSETFESLTQGALNGQNRWESTATAVITNSQVAGNGTVYAGSKGAQTTNSGQASISFTDAQTNVWAEVYVRPALGAAPNFPADATVVYYFNTGGVIVAYDGATPRTLGHTPVSSNSFARLTANLKYQGKTWDLYLEGTQIATNFNFYSNSVSGFTRFGFHSTNNLDVAGYWDNVNISIANLIGGFQITNETTSSGDVTVYVGDGDSSRTYHIIAVDNDARLTKSTVYTTVNPAGGAFTYTDSGVLNDEAVTSRYYQVVEVGGGVSTNPTVWVMQKQSRGSNAWHMAAAPAQYGDTNENRLSGMLGQQLGSGLVPRHNETLAPNMWAWDDGLGGWTNFWINTNGTWYSGASDPTTYYVEPERGFWIKTKPTDPGASNTVFTGQAHTETTGISMTSNTWILFSWPFAEMQFESEGSAGNKGWGFFAQGGTTGASWNVADRMFVEYAGRWHNLYLGAGGRWYLQNSTQTPTIALEHGKSYYYYGQGPTFVWQSTPTN